MATVHDRAAFARHAADLGLTAADWNRPFMYAGTAFRLVGLNPARIGLEIIAVRIADNRVIALPKKVVLRLLMP